MSPAANERQDGAVDKNKTEQKTKQNKNNFLTVILLYYVGIRCIDKTQTGVS